MGGANADTLLLAAVIRGDLEEVKSLVNRNSDHDRKRLTLLTKHNEADEEGMLLHFAISNDHHHVVSFLWPEMVQVMGSTTAVQDKTHATFHAFVKRRYHIIFLLFSLGVSPNHQGAHGNTLLHLCCDQPKPPMNFLRKLCRLKQVDPNIVNAEGLLPIHLLCMRCTGLEGKDAMLLLKVLGTDLDAPTRDGRTPAQLTKNYHIREALSLSTPYRIRLMPRLAEDEESRLKETPISELLSRPLTLPKDLKLQDSRDDSLHKGKKLSPEDEAATVERLYQASMQHRQQKREALIQKYVSDPSNRILSQEEMDEFTQRHFYDQEEYRQAKIEELREKYVQDLVSPAQLSPDELADAVNRLYSQALEQTSMKMKQLNEKYVMSTTSPRVIKSPASIREGVKVLYDKAVEDSATRHKAAAEKYCPDPPVPCKKMPLVEIEATVTRLYGKS